MREKQQCSNRLHNTAQHSTSRTYDSTAHPPKLSSQRLFSQHGHAQIVTGCRQLVLGLLCPPAAKQLLKQDWMTVIHTALCILCSGLQCWHTLPVLLNRTPCVGWAVCATSSHVRACMGWPATPAHCRATINRYGFNSAGAEAAAAHLDSFCVQAQRHPEIKPGKAVTHRYQTLRS